ncbi:MAG TPA: GAF domain-containing protein [Roseiflexaceae bacterium]|nr:GAF domain-containing protein [Roseiflexaceae bacterium]
MAGARDSGQQREILRRIGAAWQVQEGNPEVLAELGLALSEKTGLDTSVVLSEMLMAFGASREEMRSRDWERLQSRRMAELRGLHRIISAANSTLDLDTSMQTVVETVGEVMNVNACSVYLYDRASNDLTLRATMGLNRDAVGQVRLAMGEGITGWAAQEGHPVVIRDGHAETRFHHEPMLGEEDFRAILAVPIVLFSAERFRLGAANLQGVITIQTSDAREFSAEEINFVETVAGELAFFIINAQIFQDTDDKLHQKVRELTTLQQVSRLIAEQHNLEKALKLIVEKAVELAHVDRAAIFHSGDDGVLSLAASHGELSGDGVLAFIEHSLGQGRPLAVHNALNDTRFPDLAAVAAREGFVSLFCTPLRVQQRIIGTICLYTREPRHFDYEQVRLLSMFADEAAIAIEKASLYEESQRALKIKSAMLQEMHHRVRNNLQTISSLLAMQQRRMEAGNSGAIALRDSASRIEAIAMVHNLLCRADIGVTTLDALVRQLIDSASASLVSPDKPVAFEVRGDEIEIGSHEATVLAIVLNELINNAIFHGLSAEGGQVLIESHVRDGIVTVEVRDDGPTRKQGEPHASSSGLGLQIINTLVKSDLDGEFELCHDDSEWTCARVRFPHRVSDKV